MVLESFLCRHNGLEGRRIRRSSQGKMVVAYTKAGAVEMETSGLVQDIFSREIKGASWLVRQ